MAAAGTEAVVEPAGTAAAVAAEELADTEAAVEPAVAAELAAHCFGFVDFQTRS